MRIVRSTVLRVMNSREAKLVLDSSSESLSKLSLDQLRRRADQAHALCDHDTEVAERHLRAARSGDRIGQAQLARDMAARSRLFGEAAKRYGQELDRRDSQLRPAYRERTPRGVAVISITGKRVAPGVTAPRKIQVRKRG
jgi:hypothetical protein